MSKTGARKTAGKRAGRKRRTASSRDAGPSRPRAKTRTKTRAKTRAKPRNKPRARKQASDPAAFETVMAAFAHDVRTPLTGVLALADLLATSGLEERERRWALAIKDAAEHVADLTGLIVEGARAGAGFASRAQVFDLHRFVAALVASLAARAEAKNLACATEIAADLPQHVVGDAVQLRTALENLTANAVKFTDNGKVGLTVSAAPLARGRTRVTFAVSDSGVGMTAAEARRLFRPFAQANRGIGEKFGGAGLGLVQVRRLARAMHGNLALASKPGSGSTFRLSVVVGAAAADGTDAPARAVEPERSRRPLRVLCVEDNPFGRVVMNAILTELGHRVDFTGSGEAAIAAVEGDRYDAVLMDIALADLDGFEATRRIRALPGPAALVPIIGISGRANRADADAARAAGMQEYLVKPAGPRTLADALARVQEKS
jgi:two-component system, sensor histidine kinase